MNLFVDDRLVRIVQWSDSAASEREYDIVLNAQTATLKAHTLQGHVLVTNASLPLIDRLFNLMREKKLQSLRSVTLAVEDKKAIISGIKKGFKIIKAGGGLVLKGDKMLLMYRLKKWDLPKGKLEKNEKSKAGALREVEEECNVEVQLDYKICSTWHTYTQNGNKILKKTNWYVMSCLNDAKMKPQVEESIEELAWMSPDEAQQALENSYSSIRYVFEQFYALQKAAQE